jgi:hypothetical protein
MRGFLTNNHLYLSLSGPNTISRIYDLAVQVDTFHFSRQSSSQFKFKALVSLDRIQFVSFETQTNMESK